MRKGFIIGKDLEGFTERKSMNIRMLLLGFAIVLFAAIEPQAGNIVYFDDLPKTTVALPEPTTIIAGTLLLLPFLVSAFRMLRKRHTS
jgi:hypothetical protein